MKAAVLKEQRKMVIEEVPTPTAGPGEIVLKMKYVGICGSDLHLYMTGLMPPDTILGHECAGIVVEVGEGVEGWQVGDRAAVHGGRSCGKCFLCRNGNSNICRELPGIGLGANPGGYAEYLRVMPDQMAKVPDGVSLQDASLLDPFSTAYRGIRLAGFGMRETALVMGAGPIGLCVIQQLKLAGARVLVATEGVERRAKAAKAFGADVVMDPNDDVLTKLEDLTGGIGIDYVFECVGVPDTTQEAFRLVRIAGKVVFVGVCMEPATVMPVFWLIKEVSMQTTMGFSQSEFETSLDLIDKGVLTSDGLVTETVPLDAVPDAFERLLTPNDEIKVLVGFDD
jgi:(R,R)-butanediol dehydrogenase/meso-butanediol dehydrogenase/diacetyl reductase